MIPGTIMAGVDVDVKGEKEEEEEGVDDCSLRHDSVDWWLYHSILSCN